MQIEPTMLVAFKENPFFFLLSFFFAIVSLGLALGALVSRDRPRGSSALGFAAALVGALALASGAYDCAHRKATIPLLLAMPDLTAKDIARITADQRALAEQPRRFGMAAGSLPMLAGLALGLAGLARSRRSRVHLASAGASM